MSRELLCQQIILKDDNLTESCKKTSYSETLLSELTCLDRILSSYLASQIDILWSYKELSRKMYALLL